MSRLLTMGLALVLVAGVAGAQNLFDNGTFEAGEINEASWTDAVWSNASAGVTYTFQSTEQSHGGTQSMKWDIPGGQEGLWSGSTFPPGGGATDVGLDVYIGQPGIGSLIIKAWVYHVGSDTATYFGAPAAGLTNGTTINGSWSGGYDILRSEGAWGQVGGKRTNSGSGTWAMRWENYGSQEYDTEADRYIAYFDDITMEQAPLSTLLNGDFETGTMENWPNTPYGTNGVSDTNPRSGTYSMWGVNPQDTSEVSWWVSTQQVELDPADVGEDAFGTIWAWVENFAGATYGGSPAYMGWRYRTYNDAYAPDTTNPWRWVQPAQRTAGDTMPEFEWVEFPQWCAHIEEDPLDGNQGDGIFGWELYEYGCHQGSGGDVVVYYDDGSLEIFPQGSAVDEWHLY
jgi:hypothetical protein